MAIAFVASSSVTQGSVSASTYTTSFTTSSGTDRALIVFVFTNQTGDIITGITYNGTSMTRVAAFDTLQGGQNAWLYCYQLVAPSTGTNNVVVSFSATYNDDITLVCHEYTGVNQTTPTDGTDTNTLAASPSTVAITTTVDNCWLVSVARGASVAASASTNTTQRQSGSGALFASGDSNGPQTPAGSTSQVWTVSSGNIATLGFALAPAGGAAANGNFLAFM